jgi:hypothetical protein
MEETTRRTKHRWEVSVKIHLKEAGCEGVEWIHMADDWVPFSSCSEHGSKPSGSITGREFLE